MQKIKFARTTSDKWVERALKFVDYTTSQGYSYGEAHQFTLTPAIPSHFVLKEGFWSQLGTHFAETSLLYEGGAVESHPRAMQRQILSSLWSVKDEQVEQELLWNTISALMNVPSDTKTSTEALDKQMRQFSWFQCVMSSAHEDRTTASNGFISLDAKGRFLSIIAYHYSFD